MLPDPQPIPSHVSGGATDVFNAAVRFDGSLLYDRCLPLDILCVRGRACVLLLNAVRHPCSPMPYLATPCSPDHLYPAWNCRASGTSTPTASTPRSRLAPRRTFSPSTRTWSALSRGFVCVSFQLSTYHNASFLSHSRRLLASRRKSKRQRFHASAQNLVTGFRMSEFLGCDSP